MSSPAEDGEPGNKDDRLSEERLKEVSSWKGQQSCNEYDIIGGVKLEMESDVDRSALIYTSLMPRGIPKESSFSRVRLD